jgi:hypothetical protein
MGAFPEEFVEKVKERYPDHADSLHSSLLLADPGCAMYILDRYVHDHLVRGIGAIHIVDLLVQGKGDELLAEAKQILEDEELYKEGFSIAVGTNRPWKM